MEEYYEEVYRNASEAIEKILDIIDKPRFPVESDNKAVIQITLPKNTEIDFEIKLSLPENAEETMTKNTKRKIIDLLRDEELDGNLETLFHKGGCDSLTVIGTLCIPQD